MLQIMSRPIRPYQIIEFVKFCKKGHTPGSKCTMKTCDNIERIRHVASF